MAQRALTILSGLAKGKVYPLSAERVTLGRADECTVTLDDNDVSREHAVLALEGQDYLLKDLQSRNGTRVNGQRVQEKLLVPGDRIQFGLVEAKYEATQPAAPKPAPVVRLPQRQPAAPAAPPAPPVRAAPRPPVPAPPAPTGTSAPPVPPASPPPKVVAVPSADEQKLRATLAAAQAELTQARAKAARAEELTCQNQELTGRVMDLRGQLEQATKELAPLRAELAETREHAGRVTGLSRDNQELNARLAEQRHATERETARVQEALAGQTALRAEIKALQGDRPRLEELERKNQELTGLLATLQTREKAIVARAHADQDRLTQQLAGVQADWENAKRRVAQADSMQQQNQILATQVASLRVELTNARRQSTEQKAATPVPVPASAPQVVVPPRPAAPLSRLRDTLAAREPPPSTETPAAPEPPAGRPGLTPAAVKVLATERAAEFERTQFALREATDQLAKIGATDAAGRDLTEEKQNGAARLKALQARLTETETQDAERALVALRRLKEDLGRTRTDLQRPGVGAGEPPGLTPGPARPTPGLPRQFWAMAGAGAAVVLLAAGFLTWRSMQFGPEPALTTTATPAAAPSSAPADPQPEKYVDPQGRFACEVPRGWTVQDQSTDKRSRVRFLSGSDEIRVTSYGADWPPVRTDDFQEVEKAIESMLRLDNEAGEYAKVLSRTWRQVEGVPAFQSDMRLAVDMAEWHLRVIYFRHRGREHMIALYIRSLDQEQYLKLVLDDFLGGFESRAREKPDQAAHLAEP